MVAPETGFPLASFTCTTAVNASPAGSGPSGVTVQLDAVAEAAPFTNSTVCPLPDTSVPSMAAVTANSPACVEVMSTVATPLAPETAVGALSCGPSATPKATVAPSTGLP